MPDLIYYLHFPRRTTGEAPGLVRSRRKGWGWGWGAQLEPFLGFPWEKQGRQGK